MRTILIDADITLYQHASACMVETSVDPDENLWFWATDLSEVVEGVNLEIEELVDTLKADRHVLCFSGPNNFRKDLLPSYKENRSGKPKPVGYNKARQRLMDTHQYFLKPQLEADDCLGILATSDVFAGEKIIVSIDKDLRQIPGLLYQGEEVEEIMEEEALYWHFIQTLTGDATDNYKGCPGYGPKTAQKLWDNTIGDWAIIVEAYESKGLTEEDALVQARVAKILDADWYDFTRKEVVLWSPPIS